MVAQRRLMLAQEGESVSRYATRCWLIRAYAELRQSLGRTHQFLRASNVDCLGPPSELDMQAGTVWIPVLYLQLLLALGSPAPVAVKQDVDPA